MGHLIDDLLKLSRVTRSEMQRLPVNLTALAETIAAELREREPGRAVTFTAQPGLTAECDPALVRIVLENLLGNAWKFTAKNSKATIRFEQPKQHPPALRRGVGGRGGGPSSSATMALGSTWHTQARCSARFKGCTRIEISPERASAWRPFNESSVGMAATFGQRGRSAAGPLSSSLSTARRITHE